MKIGFIGLGNVGGKLAGSLLRNKFDLTVRDLEENIISDFINKGSKTANNAKELAEQVDLIYYLFAFSKNMLWSHGS